jgi:hypothetical protein
MVQQCTKILVWSNPTVNIQEQNLFTNKQKKDTKIWFNMKIIKIGYKRKETLSP